MAKLVLDDKVDCFGLLREKIWLGQKGLAFHPGPVLPPRADGSPFHRSINSFAEKLEVNSEVEFFFYLLFHQFKIEIGERQSNQNQYFRGFETKN